MIIKGIRLCIYRMRHNDAVDADHHYDHDVNSYPLDDDDSWSGGSWT